MAEPSANKDPRFVRILGFCLFSLYEALLYCLSLLGPALLIYHWRSLALVALIPLAIAGYVLAGLTFLSLLIMTKRFIFKWEGYL